MIWTSWERSKPLVRVLIAWTLLSLALHLIWEAVQLPLYTVWNAAAPWYIVWAVIHCTAGDGIIALASFLAASVRSRAFDWPWRGVRKGLPVLIATGIVYTAFSEWHNVYLMGALD